MRLEPLDLDMRHLVLSRIEERARCELHEVVPAPLVAGQQSQRAGRLRARLIGAIALQAVALRTVPEVDLQRAAHDRLDAGIGKLVGELQRAEQVAGIRKAHSGKAVCRRQFGEL